MAKKIEISVVEKWFTDRGSKLTSVFVNCGTQITFLCSICKKEVTHKKFTRLKKDNPRCVCVECHFDGMRLKKEDIENWFKERNSELFNTITSVQQAVTFKCSNCGNKEDYCTYNSLRIVNPRCLCKECNNKKISQDTMQQWFLYRGSILVSIYENNLSKLEFTCSKCFSLTVKDYAHLQTEDKATPDRVTMCSSCKRKLMSERFTYPRERAETYFSSRGSKLLSWNGYFEPIQFVCRKCGASENYTSFGQIYKNRELWCKDCWREFYTGSNNPRYNHSLTAEERVSRRGLPGYSAWIKKVFQNHRYACVINGSWLGVREAHHLYNWKDFEYFRFLIWNGVILSEENHAKFHSQYGFGKNTFSQFKDFYQEVTGKEYFLFQTKTTLFDVISHFTNLQPSWLLLRKKDFQEKGVNYIPIFENEILEKPKIIDSIILTRAEQKEYLTKVHARKLEVKELSSEESSLFFENNHRQGNFPAKVSLGLCCPKTKEVISAMSFSSPRFDDTCEWELLRFCSKIKHIVPGAASRLFSYFKLKCNPKSIVSYCDIRFSSLDPKNTVYPHLGFQFSHSSKPNYSYHKEGIFYSRLKFQKHKLPALLENFKEELSERDNMLANGYDIREDCGNHVFIWNSENP